MPLSVLLPLGAALFTLCRIPTPLVFCRFLWYSFPAADSFAVEGGESMEIIITLIISVMAGVIADRICKWLDGK